MDIDTIEENLLEEYVIECERLGCKPSLSDFKVYLEEHYD